MYIANHWETYEVLETSGGDKLERWGAYILRRPDPQVIWETAQTHPGWKKPNAHYHRSRQGGGEWEFFDLPKQWELSYVLGGAEPEGDLAKLPAAERALRFQLKPFAFKHTGLFPEQAANWDWFAEKICGQTVRRRAAGNVEPLRVLNLFAYTGGATLAAARAGAAVTHVDASKGMVQWAKENAQLSGLGTAPIRWLVDDCQKFVERELRRGRRYDAVIMDPPSYGRGPKGELWKLEDAVFPLVQLCAQLLSEDALFFLINSYTTGLQPAVLDYMLGLTLLPRFGGMLSSQELGLPVRSCGLALPCGASGRWSR